MLFLSCIFFVKTLFKQLTYNSDFQQLALYYCMNWIIKFGTMSQWIDVISFNNFQMADPAQGVEGCINSKHANNHSWPQHNISRLCGTNCDEQNGLSYRRGSCCSRFINITKIRFKTQFSTLQLALVQNQHVIFT